MLPQYNPLIHHRRSIRLHGYDYAQSGLYFITICCQDRLHLFGNIQNGEMIYDDAGRMIEKWYRELENKYPDKRCHEMMVMPNHFHCIIENMADTDVLQQGAHAGAPLRGRPNNERGRPIENYGIHNKIRHATIGDAVGWFKTMTTNEYIVGVKNKNWQPFNGKLWQRNYYERIIRDEKSYERISAYIANNPKKWDDDMFHTL